MIMPRKKATAAETAATETKAPAKRSSSKTSKTASETKPKTSRSSRKGPDVRVLFASSEVAPFAASGGLADVAGSLPVYLNRSNCDVRVILPLYSSISKDWRDKMRFITYCYVSLSWRSAYCGIFELKDRGVTYYFIDNEQYFKRSSLYGEYDDGERFAFFSKRCSGSADSFQTAATGQDFTVGCSRMIPNPT